MKTEKEIMGRLEVMKQIEENSVELGIFVSSGKLRAMFVRVKMLEWVLDIEEKK